MVRFSTSFAFLATVAVVFASPYVKRVDDIQLLQDLDTITGQFCQFQEYVCQFSADSTIDDALYLHNLAEGLMASFDTAAFDAADCGELTPSSASDAVQKLFVVEPYILDSMHCLIDKKPFLLLLGATHQTEKDIVQLHAKSTNMANTIRVNIPDYLEYDWQSVESPIQRMFQQATIAYSDS